MSKVFPDTDVLVISKWHILAVKMFGLKRTFIDNGNILTAYKYKDAIYITGFKKAPEPVMFARKMCVDEIINTFVGITNMSDEPYIHEMAEHAAQGVSYLNSVIEKLNARCDRDDKLIFQMKDEISKNKQTINQLRQKLQKKMRPR